MIRVEGVLPLINVINSGMFNPDTYKQPRFAHLSQRCVEDAIKIRRAVARDSFALAIKRKNDSADFNKQDVAPDSKAGAGGPTVTPDITPGDLANFWLVVNPSDKKDYETQIESYFLHPQIAAIYAWMRQIEQAWDKEELESMCAACKQGIIPTGYVYAGWNILFGHLIKIGATMRTPQIRLRELSGTGMPEPFEMVACIPSDNPFALEKAIHRHFDSVRTYGRRKEFFTLTRAQVVAHFKTLGGSTEAPTVASGVRTHKVVSEAMAATTAEGLRELSQKVDEAAAKAHEASERASKAELETKLMELELRRQEAIVEDEEESRKRRRAEAANAPESTATVMATKEKRMERRRGLECIVRTAVALTDVTNECAELADLYVLLGEDDTTAKARKHAESVWRKQQAQGRQR